MLVALALSSLVAGSPSGDLGAEPTARAVMGAAPEPGKPEPTVRSPESGEGSVLQGEILEPGEPPRSQGESLETAESPESRVESPESGEGSKPQGESSESASPPAPQIDGPESAEPSTEVEEPMSPASASTVPSTGVSEAEPSEAAGPSPEIDGQHSPDEGPSERLRATPIAPPDGQGLYRAGIIVTTAAGLTRIGMFTACAFTQDFGCIPLILGGLTFGGLGAAAGLSMLGVGADRVGKRLAYDEVFLGGPGLRSRERLGWALFGTGLGLWSVSRIVILASDHDVALLIEEAGWYASLPFTATGLAIALKSRSFRRNRPGFENYRSAAMTPSLTLFPGGGIVSVSGRF